MNKNLRNPAANPVITIKFPHLYDEDWRSMQEMSSETR